MIAGHSHARLPASMPRQRASLGVLGARAQERTGPNRRNGAHVGDREPPAPAPAGAVPDSLTTLVQVLEWHAAQHDGRRHVLFYRSATEVDEVTYGELLRKAQCIAAELRKRGLAPGQCVALLLPTSLEFLYCFCGVLLAGLTPVPLAPPADARHLEDHLQRQLGILRNCRAPLIVTTRNAKRLLRLTCAQVATVRHVVLPEELLCSAPEPVHPRVEDESVALVQYTSGSTGNPKGVVLTHASLLANIRAFSAAVQLTSTDVFVSWLPLWHDMGLIGCWLGSLYNGCPLVLMAPQQFLKHPERWLWAVHRHRATVSAAPNFAFEFCTRKVLDRDLIGLDLSSWRWIGNGAEPVFPETLARFSQRFARYGLSPEALAPVYGLAECSLAVTIPPLGRRPRVDRVSRDPYLCDGFTVAATIEDTDSLAFVACGPPLPGHHVRIVGADGRELRERSVGSIQVRGPSTMRGYLGHAESMGPASNGGWLDTGDLGYLAAGELYPTGRVKDIIIRGGRKFCPYALEEAVGNLPRVAKGGVIVFGAANKERATESLVILAEAGHLEFHAQNALRLTINKLALQLYGTTPDDIVLVPRHTILKTSSGKQRRAAMRALYERGALVTGRVPLTWQLARMTWRALRARIGRWRQMPTDAA